MPSEQRKERITHQSKATMTKTREDEDKVSYTVTQHVLGKDKMPSSQKFFSMWQRDGQKTKRAGEMT